MQPGTTSINEARKVPHVGIKNTPAVSEHASSSPTSSYSKIQATVTEDTTFFLGILASLPRELCSTRGTQGMAAPDSERCKGFCRGCRSNADSDPSDSQAEKGSLRQGDLQ